MSIYSFFIIVIPLLGVSLNAHLTANPQDDEDRTTETFPNKESERLRLRRSEFLSSHIHSMGSSSITAGILNPSVPAVSLNPQLNPALIGGMIPGGGMVPAGGMFQGGGVHYNGGILPRTLTGSYPHSSPYQPNIGLPVGDHGVHTAAEVTHHGGGGGGGGGLLGGGGGGGGGRK